jgi:hypothetical protein
MSVFDAVQLLLAVQGDLALAARGMEVDQAELTTAMQEADADSAEAVAMRYLVKPQVEVVPKPAPVPKPKK